MFGTSPLCNGPRHNGCGGGSEDILEKPLGVILVFHCDVEVPKDAGWWQDAQIRCFCLAILWYPVPCSKYDCQSWRGGRLTEIRRRSSCRPVHRRDPTRSPSRRPPRWTRPTCSWSRCSPCSSIWWWLEWRSGVLRWSEKWWWTNLTSKWHSYFSSILALQVQKLHNCFCLRRSDAPILVPLRPTGGFHLKTELFCLLTINSFLPSYHNSLPLITFDWILPWYHNCN